jgi:orotate phosphoribosyltransferase
MLLVTTGQRQFRFNPNLYASGTRSDIYIQHRLTTR